MIFCRLQACQAISIIKEIKYLYDKIVFKVLYNVRDKQTFNDKTYLYITPVIFYDRGG